MKRFLASALVLGVVSSFGLVGCGEEQGTKTEELAVQHSSFSIQHSPSNPRSLIANP